MALREDFEKIGNWFFRWRSYLPLVLGFLFLVSLKTVYYPLYPDTGDKVWELICFSVSLLGLVIRGIAVGSAPRGTSGRNVSEQRATALNTTGLYSLLRHPLYLGNFFLWVGAALFVRSWWLALATAFIFWFYYEKIMYAEEEFLRRQYGETFVNWSSRTPAFFPYKLKNWRKPELPFSFRNAIRREYSGFFAVISLFSVLKVFQDRITFGRFMADEMWRIIFLIGLAAYLILLTLKKRTNLLDVKGR